MNVFDVYWERYDRWYEKHRDLFERELEFIRRNVGRFKVGLEVGVGTGRFAKELGIRYGIDISKPMLKLAKERGVEVVLGNAYRLPFKRVFDAVFFIFTLCFLDKPLNALISAKEVTVKGGKVVACVIPKESKLAEEYLRKDSPFYRSARFYESKEVVDMLERAGFDVVKTDFENLRYERDLFIAVGVNEKV